MPMPPNTSKVADCIPWRPSAKEADPLRKPVMSLSRTWTGVPTKIPDSRDGFDVRPEARDRVSGTEWSTW